MNYNRKGKLEKLVITGITNSFGKQWTTIFGTVPSIETINYFLKKSIMIQPRKVLYDRFFGQEITMLAIYWIPTEDLILKIDTLSKTAVTFYASKKVRKVL